MSAITGVCAKIINVICYNFMVICGEINKDWEQEQFHTSFVEFYGSMIKTPFFGDYYNVLAPLMILILSLMFAVLGLFKYNSKNLEAIVMFNQKRENTSDNKKSRVDKQFQKNKSIQEKVLLGEKAILKEYDSMKSKYERKRHSIYGASHGFGSLLGSFSEDKKVSQPRQQDNDGLFKRGKNRGR